MAQFTNAQILSAVVAEWIRPALAQIAAGKVSGTQFAQSMQQAMVGFNIVGAGYNIASDIEPLALPVINALVQPMLCRMFSQVDDSAIPQMARNVLSKMGEKETYSIMDGLVTFDKEDISELSRLIEKNLPLQKQESYQVIH